MRETRLFCAKTSRGHRDFFLNPLGVKMCGHDESCIIEVRVREVIDQDDPIQFGWWDNAKSEFSLVFPHRLLVEACFPYGTEVEIKQGTGNLYGVIIEEIGESKI